MRKGTPPWGRFQLPDAEAQRTIITRCKQFRMAIDAGRGTEEQRCGLRKALRVLAEARARIGRAWRSKASCEIELGRGTSTTRRTVIPRGRVAKAERKADPDRSSGGSGSEDLGGARGEERVAGGVKQESVKREGDAASDEGSWGSAGQASSSSRGGV